MRLETEEGEVLEAPSAEAIRLAVEGLGGSRGTFAILTRRDDPAEYLQTSGGGDAFLVEYHEHDAHFRAADEALPAGTVAALFQAYARGDPAWGAAQAWRDVTAEVLGVRHPRLRRVAYVALAALVIALVVLAAVLRQW